MDHYGILWHCIALPRRIESLLLEPRTWLAFKCYTSQIAFEGDPNIKKSDPNGSVSCFVPEPCQKELKSFKMPMLLRGSEWFGYIATHLGLPGPTADRGRGHGEGIGRIADWVLQHFSARFSYARICPIWWLVMLQDVAKCCRYLNI